MEISYTPKNNNEVTVFANLCKAMISKGFDLSGCGYFDKNKYSGNLYLWLEDCPITPFCKENSARVEWCWSCPNCGEEIIGTYAVCMAEQRKYEKNDRCEACFK